MVRGGEALRKRQVIRMRMGHEDHPDCSGRDPFVERGEMGFVVRSRIDHRKDRARLREATERVLE